jgi:hypothetical protein
MAARLCIIAGVTRSSAIARALDRARLVRACARVDVNFANFRIADGH